jgi:putative membrane protein
MAALYPWLKALHIISVIAWMAGLLYLPRLFVYHCAAVPGSAQSETFKVMERRLLRAIMTPAMIASFIFGAGLLVHADWNAGWLWAKLALVAGLAVLHGMMARWRRDFAEDRNTRPAKFYRVMNEAPTVLMIAIVVLAVVKPF